MITTPTGAKESLFAYRQPGESEEGYVLRAKADIQACSDCIKQITGTKPCALAYPNGLSKALTLRAVQAADISLAFDGYRFNAIDLNHNDPYHLNRYSISQAYDVSDAVGLINREKLT